MFEDEILLHLKKVLQSGMFVLGEYTEQFEKTFAASHGRKHGIAVNSDTSALEAALCWLNFKTGTTIGVHQLIGAVLMPDSAFFGCANVVARLSGRVLTIPITISNGTLPTLEQLQTAVDWCKRSRTPIAAYMSVYNAGTVGRDTLECLIFCQDQGIPVIEDAAHCHGAKYSTGEMVGHYGDLATYSFYATKMVHSGEGGMILTDDDDAAHWLRTYRNYGKTWGPGADPVFADSDMVGYNWRMTEFQAAIGLTLWKNYAKIYDERHRVEQIYDEYFLPSGSRFGEAQVDRLIVKCNELRPNLYRYIVMVDGLLSREQNHELYALLRERLVILQAKCNSLPVSLHKALHRFILPYQPAIAAPFEALSYCMSHLCLPIYPTLSSEDAAYIAETVVDVLNKGKWR